MAHIAAVGVIAKKTFPHEPHRQCTSGMTRQA